MGFEQKTVFVVGAGAHVDYGMPTGPDLIRHLNRWSSQPGLQEPEVQMVQKAIDIAYELIPHVELDQDEHVHHHNRCKHVQRRCQEYIGRLSRSPHASIDAMLAEWPQYQQEGTRLLTALIACHQANTLKRNQPLRGWHYWLAQRCWDRDRAWDFEKMTVITFNYDRLFELHMQTMVDNSTQRSQSDVVVPVPIHVYGAVDHKAKWDNELQCHTSEHIEAITKQSDSAIRIASDRDGETDVYLSCRRVLDDADRVVFLGFAFDHLNLRQLGLSSGDSTQTKKNIARTQCHVFATAYGLDERQQISAGSGIGGRVSFGGPIEDCVTCLRRWNI
jgi:hypothetical protein